MLQKVYNKLDIYKNNSDQIICQVKDEYGNIFDLTNYDSYLYAKKYPLKANDNYTLKMRYSDIDIASGSIIFNITPGASNIAPGDYLYEVIISNELESKTVAQNKMTINKSIYDNYVDEFDIAPTSFLFSPYDTSLALNISTPAGNPWTIGTLPTWLSASKTFGAGTDIVYLYPDPSIALNQAQTTIRITTNSTLYRDFTVQYQFATTLTSTLDDHTFTLDNSIYTFNIQTDDLNPWTISVPVWLTSDKVNGIGNDTVTLTLNDYTKTTQSGNIVITSYYATGITKLVDADLATTLTISPESFTFDPSLNHITISLKTDIHNYWNLQGPFWFQNNLHMASGYGDASIVVQINQLTSDVSSGRLFAQSALAPSAYMDVAYSNYVPLTISPSELDFDFYNLSKKFYIETTGWDSWYVSGIPIEWSVTGDLFGFGDTSINLTRNQRYTSTPDTSVRVQHTYGPDQYFTVSYSPNIVTTINPSTFVFDNNNLSKTFALNTENNFSWAVRASTLPSSWFKTVSPSQGTNDASILLECYSQTADKPVSTIIFDSSGGASCSVDVSFKFLKSLTIDPSSDLIFTPDNSTWVVDVSTASDIRWNMGFYNFPEINIFKLIVDGTEFMGNYNGFGSKTVTVKLVDEIYPNQNGTYVCPYEKPYQTNQQYQNFIISGF